MKQIIYYHEGKTEKQLLQFLKKHNKIKSGKAQVFNLWSTSIKKIKRNFSTNPKNLELFFIIDTDRIKNTKIFIQNLSDLQSYNICLIIQHKNFEEELSYTCSKKNNLQLFQDFYKVDSKNEFTAKFIKESNINKKLADNNFDFNKLWSRKTEFKTFMHDNYIKTNIDCNYKLCTTKP